MSKTADTVTVHVPFTIRKYGGRKQIMTPSGAPAVIEKPRVDSTLLKALARAFRWKKMLESGQFTTITELAKHENLALRCCETNSNQSWFVGERRNLCRTKLPPLGQSGGAVALEIVN